MNWKSISKRFLVMLLVLSMVTGLVPVSAFAAGSDAEQSLSVSGSASGQVVDAAIIFSDLHTSKNDYKESTVKGIFGALKKTGLPFSSVTSAGDAFSVNADNDGQNGKYTGDPTKITGYIQSALEDSSIPVNYVWSDHDRYATGIENVSGLVYGAGEDGLYGTADDGNYYVYALSMADMSTYNRYNAAFYSDSDVTAHIAAFEDAAEELDQTKPLFVVSHQPLLDRRGDNGHAYEWAEAINEVAEEMDVAYFFGHNHKYDEAGDYYYAKGSTMPVATTEVLSGSGYNTDLEAKNVVLNFPHICAGYMAPGSTGSTSNTTRQGTAMAITIYEDSIRYTTYDKNGVYDGSYAVDETVTRDHAGTTETPVEPDEPETPEAVKDTNGTGITVAAPGVTAVSVQVIEEPEYDAAVYAAYASYDITPEGYVGGTTATVSVPAPENFDVNNPVLVLDQGKVIATTNIVKGKITFTTNHFSVYDVAQAAETAEEEGDTQNRNNYPEYPDEGAVKVNKTGTGIDFQSTGVAQVEISASGVPMKKGADIIIMLDTSSSMTKNTVTGTNKTRDKVLEESLVDLIAFFKTETVDTRVAIADFNGYYGDGSGGTSGTPYDRTKGDYVKNGNSNGSGYSQRSKAQVYTGSKALDAGAFVSASDLAESYTLTYTSGTNYDYAFDAIYQLGTAIKAQNTEERDLYVIFMSDGASLQWNYFGTQNTYTKWNNWLAGTWEASDLTTSNLNSTAHSYFYDLNDHDGDGQLNEHRMANAIKGDPSKRYEVIRKSTAGLPKGTLVSAGKEYLYTVPGLGAKMFTINFDARDDGSIKEENIDKALASTASDPDGNNKYYYKITRAEDLQHAFDSIATAINYAAYNARFVDKMGKDYDLQAATTDEVTPKIEVIEYDIYTNADAAAGKIPAGKQIGDRKGTYEILETVTFETEQQTVDGKEQTVITAAYSDLIGNGRTNILAPKNPNDEYADDVIYARSFLYNTNIVYSREIPAVTDANGNVIFSVDIPTGVDGNNLTTGSTNVLPAESFYWNLGTVKTSEMALRYYVYLTGSMEGTRPGGSYPTNEYANLYYDNYLGNDCHKDTVSPVMPWKEANVSYAFYLVDENGKIVVNQTTGETGSFANKIAVTNPVLFDTVLLNTSEQIDSVEAAKVLPEGYTLYDGVYRDGVLEDGATYTVTVNSNSTGSWVITSTKGEDDKSTYVTQHNLLDASAYDNTRNVNTDSYDYTHTVVWFAVVWNIKALPDTVVVDYGLPVDISVMDNDMFGEKGKLVGVGEWKDSLRTVADRSTNQLSDTTYSGTYGTAEVKNGKVRYTLSKEMGMQMNSHERFGYSAQYTGEKNSAYYYETVTVIPATTIYYEDSFLTLHASGTAWVDEGTAIAGATQGEDRPGKYSLTDANNIYGYDGVNNSMSQFSLGTAKKVHVDADSSATADFTFCGTGFDIISMTSNTTGVLAVKVTAAADVRVDGEVVYAAGSKVCAPIVDTYYGYTTEVHEIVYTYTDGEWVAEDKGVNAEAQTTAKPANPQEGDTYTEQKQVWVPAPNMENAIYQVPVIQVNDLPYGSYHVTLTATYMDVFDHTSGEDGYDLYLDAVRIYDPANDGAGNQVIEKAYTDDHEGWPSYIELRNVLIEANEFDGLANDVLAQNMQMEGVVFIDGDSTVGNAQISDYINFGPNNEVYLAPGQRVAFMLSDVKNATGKSIVDRVHVSIKSADGKTGTYTITNIAFDDYSETVKRGTYYNNQTATVNTTTDMYYDLTGWKHDIIVISNTGNRHGTEGVISITNIKTTYTAKPPVKTGDKQAEVTAYMTPKAAALTLKALKPAPFADVMRNQFFYDSVLWAVEKGITNGVDAAHFGPTLECNRAQVVTFLWRAAGSPAPVSRNNPFSDVPADSWYTDAVLWAVENGITNGLTATTFGPDALCNRAQVVTFLWRANGSRASVNAVNLFTDVPADAFYHDAVVWALENGITTGATDTAFDPNGTCMRAHVVTFLYRAAQLPKLELSGMKSES